MENLDLIKKYLDEHIYYGLTNLNDGFDVESIKYFDESDFKIILERVEALELGIHGIEPWLNGSYYDVYTSNDYGLNSIDPKWYNKAFNDFISKGEFILYAATIYIPNKNRTSIIKI